jgi:AraC-like DNA-binding protein
MMTGEALRFSLRGVPGPARGRALAALVDQGLLPVEPLADADPHIDLLKWRLPQVGVLWARMSGVRQGTTRGLRTDELFVAINVAGASRARQRGADIAVGAGAAVVADPRSGDFAVTRAGRCHMIGLRIDRDAVPALGRPGKPGLQVIPAGNAALGLLTSYLRAAGDEPPPASAVLADAFVRHLADLIALGMAAGTGSAELPATAPSVRAARFAAIKADIGQHLTDSPLTVSEIAGRHGITGRYLHKLFEDEETTFRTFVLHQRLDLAHQRLRDPRYAHRTITAIAAGAGFADQSYFGRTFRRRFGITPSAARPSTRATG